MKSIEQSRKRGFDVGDLRRIYALIRKNWWIAALLGGLGYGIAYLYVFKTEKVFSCSTQLLLKQNDEFTQSSVISDPSSVYYGNVTRTYVDNSNEMRILLSQDLIEATLFRLDFDISYYLVGRVRTTEVYSGVPFRIRPIFLNPALYEQMMTFRMVSYDQYELTYTINEQVQTVTGSFDQEFTNTHMKILVTRKPSFTPGMKVDGTTIYMVQPHRVSDLAKVCLAKMSIENPQYTNVLKVSFQDVLTDRAVRFLDTLSAVYIENSLKSRVEINKNTLYYIDRQMEEVSGMLDNIEDSLEKFRRSNDVIDLDRQGELYFNSYTHYDDQKRVISLQQMALDDLEKYIIEDKDPSFLPPSAYLLATDEFENGTVEELYRKQRMLNELEQIATPQNFEIIQLKNQIDSTKRDMLVYIQNSREALKQKDKNVDEQIDYYDGQLDLLPAKQRGLLSILRLQRVNQEMYVFLLEKRANTIIGRASIVSLTQIIEKPRISGLVSPNESKLLITGLSIGLILAALIIFSRIFFFNKIESYEELKAATSLPIIGEVVSTKVEENLIIAVQHSPKSPLAESFRTIRTNLQYMSTDGGAQTIVVTSNRPGEGKTFCALNLAGVFSKGGRKVILLELDLHKPRIGKGLGITTDKGISTIAIGKSTIQESILPTEIEGMSVLLAGPLPPNPSELVTSKVMEEILEYCRANYEYVIIDTPPVGLITDAIVLMKQASITLFVLNTKFPSRLSLENAHEISAMNTGKHFGFILNGVRRKKSRYYYNHYGYGYSGYGSYGGYGGYGSYGGGYGSYGSSGGSGSSSKGFGKSRMKNKDDQNKN